MKNLLLSLATLTLMLSGCQTAHEVTRPSAAPVTGFLPESHKLQEQKATFPYLKLWIDDGFNWSKYKKIVVAPVNTEHLMQQDWWKKVNAQKLIADPKKDCDTIGNFMQQTFQNTLRDDPKKRFAVVDTPDAETLVLELALVELVPTKAFLNAAETVVGFFLFPVGLLTMFNSGLVAMEGRIKDGQSGKIICMFADRESGAYAVVDVAGLTWYRHAENIIEEWSRNFVAIANSEDHLNVKRNFPFKLFAW